MQSSPEHLLLDQAKLRGAANTNSPQDTAADRGNKNIDTVMEDESGFSARSFQQLVVFVKLSW